MAAKIPRDPDANMVISLLVNLYDAPEGILYELVEPVPEHERAEADEGAEEEV